MTKPRIYEMGTPEFHARIKQKPRYMWIKTRLGAVKLFQPEMDPYSLGGVIGTAETKPRYVGTVTNY